MAELPTEDVPYEAIVRARHDLRKLALGSSAMGREAETLTDAFHMGRVAEAAEQAEVALSRFLVAAATFGGSRAAEKALDA